MLYCDTLWEVEDLPTCARWVSSLLPRECRNTAYDLGISDLILHKCVIKDSCCDQTRYFFKRVAIHVSVTWELLMLHYRAHFFWMSFVEIYMVASLVLLVLYAIGLTAFRVEQINRDRRLIALLRSNLEAIQLQRFESEEEFKGPDL